MSYCTSHIGGWVGKDVPEVLFEGFEDLEQGIERDSSCSSPLLLLLLLLLHLLLLL